MLGEATQFLTVFTIFMLAVMSPGPDFAVIVKNSLGYTRRAAVFTALGIALGITVHLTYCMVGIGFLISKSILAFSLIKYAGAAYLIFLGVQSLRAKAESFEFDDDSLVRKTKADLSVPRALWEGFLTNALNPKATVFFLSLFTQVIDPDTSIRVQLFYGVVMILCTFIWFSFIAVVFTHKKIRQKIRSYQHYIMRIMGGLLILLGLKIAISSD